MNTIIEPKSIARDFIKQREVEFINYIQSAWGDLSKAELQMATLGFCFGMKCANDFHQKVEEARKNRKEELQNEKQA